MTFFPNPLTDSVTRRSVLLGLGAFALAGCASGNSRTALRAEPPTIPIAPLFYGPRPDEQFPLPAVKIAEVPPQFWRTEVANLTGEPAGTLVVDTPANYLYFTQPDGSAMRYGIGVGREGFAWSGRAKVGYKREWPRWTPPDEMVARQPELEPYSIANGGMEPGLRNPLGARALYIFQDGEDTLYRLHGTTEDWSIGKRVSSGCIRLLNQDIIDLYDRVPSGTAIKVIPV